MLLINRRAFTRELTRFMAVARRYGHASCLAYFDVDGLKQMNDRHGHGAGDAALVRVATILLDNVRGSDVVGRLGGDEFAVILVQSSLAAAEETAARLSEEVRRARFDWKGHLVGVTVSHGVHPITPGEVADEALQGGELVMYRRKRGE